MIEVGHILRIANCFDFCYICNNTNFFSKLTNKTKEKRQ